ncbi:hypothetical protein KEM52_002492 [Ascosphaera acerosa]|nr:hypothetical protein KEM52_002492 [Ascosphaera acerosa]
MPRDVIALLSAEARRYHLGGEAGLRKRTMASRPTSIAAGPLKLAARRLLYRLDYLDVVWSLRRRLYGDLALMIAAHQDEFLQLLSEDGGAAGEGEGLDGLDAPVLPGVGTHTISVTEEEREAIERLCNLGFSRESVIQAYFACDKNEELAANFLFDQPDDDEP